MHLAAGDAGDVIGDTLCGLLVVLRGEDDEVLSVAQGLGGQRGRAGGGGCSAGRRAADGLDVREVTPVAVLLVRRDALCGDIDGYRVVDPVEHAVLPVGRVDSLAGELLEPCASGEALLADELQRGGQVQRWQRLAEHEGIIADMRDALGDSDVREALASVEDVRLYACEPRAEGDGDQRLAVLERVVVDRRDGVRDRQCGQSAVVERLEADGQQGARQVDSRQVLVAVECPVADLREIVMQRYGLQRTAVEHPRSDSLQGGGYSERLDLIASCERIIAHRGDALMQTAHRQFVAVAERLFADPGDRGGHIDAEQVIAALEGIVADGCDAGRQTHVLDRTVVGSPRCFALVEVVFHQPRTGELQPAGLGVQTPLDVRRVALRAAVAGIYLCAQQSARQCQTNDSQDLSHNSRFKNYAAKV